jgi:hypothetical protein
MTPDPKTYDLNVLARAYHLELLRANHELAPGDARSWRSITPRRLSRNLTVASTKRAKRSHDNRTNLSAYPEPKE